MKSPSSTLSSLALAAALVTAAPASHAFDPADYRVTFQATHDAYMLALARFRNAEGRYKFMAGVMAIYGLGEGYVDSNAHPTHDWVQPSWCRTHEFKDAPKIAAFPERANGSKFVLAGHQRHRAAKDGYNPGRYGPTTTHSYLHFGSEGVEHQPQVALAPLLTWPYDDDTRQTEATTALQGALAAYATNGNVNPFLVAAATLAGSTYDLTSVAAHYAYEFDQGDLSLNLGPFDYYGRPCDPGGPDVCGDTGTCVANPDWMGGGCAQGAGFFSAITCHPDWEFRCFHQGVSPRFPGRQVEARQVCDLYELIGRKGEDYTYGLRSEGYNDWSDITVQFRMARDEYFKRSNELKLATGPYKAARDAYVVVMATYLKSLYE